MRQIYLDFNATTPIAPSVREAMQPFQTEHFGNPSSQHVLGRACEEAIADARQQVADLLGADTDEIVFTSSGTEANNLALKGLLQRASTADVSHLIISAIEHASVAETAKFLHRQGCEVTTVGCDGRGVVDPDEIRRALRPNTAVVSVMYANNDTGAVQPVAEISRICREEDILLHTDAVQAIGKIATKVDDLGVDLLSLSGHKCYAPKGIGALYVRRGTPLEPILHGAGQEQGLRAGTENVAYIVALGRAAMLASKSVGQTSARLTMLRDRLLDHLRAGIEGNRAARNGSSPRLTVNAAEATRLPNTLSVNFPGVNGYELLQRASEICASTGAAGYGRSANISTTLAAMGVPADVARGAVRLSLGWSTNEEEIDLAGSLLVGAWEDLHD